MNLMKMGVDKDWGQRWKLDVVNSFDSRCKLDPVNSFDDFTTTDTTMSIHSDFYLFFAKSFMNVMNDISIFHIYNELHTNMMTNFSPNQSHLPLDKHKNIPSSSNPLGKLGKSICYFR